MQTQRGSEGTLVGQFNNAILNNQIKIMGEMNYISLGWGWGVILDSLYSSRVSFSTMDSTGLCIAAGCWTEQSRVLCADESVLDHRCHRSTGPLDLPGKKTQHFFLFFFFHR